MNVQNVKRDIGLTNLHRIQLLYLVYGAGNGGIFFYFCDFMGGGRLSRPIGEGNELKGQKMNIPELHAPQAFEPAYDMFHKFLKDSFNNGIKFSNDELIQILWMWLKVEGSEEIFRILSPEFGIMPMNFIPDCSESLNLVLTQKYLVESFDAEYGLCNCMQSAIVIKDIDSCKEIFINRLGEEKNSDSGWYFGAQDSSLDSNNVDDLERRSLWELFCTYPIFGDFFLLPSGWQVVIEDSPVVLNGYSLAKYKSDSYYAEKYKK